MLSKIWLVILILIIPLQNIFSQQDTLVDVLPLAIGNEWEYHYSSMSSQDDYNSSQIGTAIYTVIGKTLETDSTRWILKEDRDVIVCSRHYFPPHGDTCYHRKDSTIFELIEMHDSSHQLYRVGYEDYFWHSVFPFTREVSETTKVFRFMSVDSGDTIKYQTRRPDFSCYSYIFTFKKNVGLIAVNCSFLCLGGDAITEHRLINAVINSIEEKNLVPKAFSLSQNYPNPFNSATEIQYNTPQRSFITLRLFDILGREVMNIAEGIQELGMHQVTLTMYNLPSGVYYYRLVARNFSSTKKFLYLK